MNNTTEKKQATEQRKIAKREYNKITKIASDIRRKEQEMKAAEHGIAGQTDQ